MPNAVGDLLLLSGGPCQTAPTGAQPASWEVSLAPVGQARGLPKLLWKKLRVDFTSLFVPKTNLSFDFFFFLLKSFLESVCVCAIRNLQGVVSRPAWGSHSTHKLCVVVAGLTPPPTPCLLRPPVVPRDSERVQSELQVDAVSLDSVPGWTSGSSSL